MEWSFDIQKLFAERFSYPINEWIKDKKYSNDSDFRYDQQNSADTRGTATRSITAKTTPKGGELYTTYKGKYYFLPIYLGGELLPHGVVKIQSKKHIVETPLVGQRGTVKEFISLEDYAISIRGFLIGDKLTWPEAEVEKLRKLYARNEAIEMRSAVTDLFLLPQKDPDEPQTDKKTQPDRVIIKALDFDEFKSTHVVAYSMELVSDSVFEIEIQ